MLAVEAAVTAYAREMGEPEELWAVTALLHDFDYERYPIGGKGGHPYVGVAHLKELGYPEEVTEAILGHADFTGVARTSKLARVLYACDEITGLITAAVLVRPDKNIANQTVKSLKKKFRDKAFAKGRCPRRCPARSRGVGRRVVGAHRIRPRSDAGTCRPP